MKKSRIAIIGGGIAGISAANELSKDGSFDVTIFEKNKFLGGLNQSIEINELNYDIGAFLYSDSHALLKTFPFLKEIYCPVLHYPMTVNDKNKFDVHPLSIRGYWKNFGSINLTLSIFSLFVAKIKHANYNSLPGYCKYFLGDRIYEKSGLKIYIQRLYQKKDSEIDIKLGYSRMNNLSNYSFRSLIKRIRTLKSDIIFDKGKLQLYVRPKEGFKVVFEYLEKHLLAQNIEIHKNTTIQSIQKKSDTFIIECNNENLVFDRVISTIPFSLTQKLIGIAPKFVPSYMKLVSLFYKGNILPDSNVIYNYTNQGLWKRITVYSKYYGLDDGQDYFSVEITVDSKKQEDLEIYKKEFEKLMATYKIATNLSFQGTLTIPYAYPVFDKGETEIADMELDSIRAFGIDLVGRQGTFEYLSSDQTIRSAQQYVKDCIIQNQRTIVQQTVE